AAPEPWPVALDAHAVGGIRHIEEELYLATGGFSGQQPRTAEAQEGEQGHRSRGLHPSPLLLLERSYHRALAIVHVFSRQKRPTKRVPPPTSYLASTSGRRRSVTTPRMIGRPACPDGGSQRRQARWRGRHAGLLCAFSAGSCSGEGRDLD